MRKVQSSNPENIAYFANLGLLGVEASNKGIIDSGCSSTVAGEEWLNTYLDALSEHKKVDVVYRNSNKWFKFGGGELLSDKTSSGIYVIDLGTFDNKPFPVENE